MKIKYISAAFISAVLLLASAGAEAATRYARPDGGTSTQCNGTVNVAYDGSGTGENCAWTLTAGVSAMAGGDVLIVANGNYDLSSGISGIKDGTSNAYTVIAGEQFGNCKVAPKLRSSAYINRFIDLTGTDYVRVECLDIADKSDCHVRSPTAATDCSSSDPWIRHALYAENGSNHVLRDLLIYGVGNGFRGARVNNSTWERVRMYMLHESGYNGSIGCGTNCTVAEFTGTHTFVDFEIAFAGCADAYPATRVRTCIGQAGGGYGDAFGTYYTAGKWVFDRVHMHHNTQDGLDGRYFNSTAVSEVRNSKFYSNAGNQVKIWGPTIVENNLINSDCAYFSRYGSAADLCRADGNAIVIFPDNAISGTDAYLRYNTIAGESASLVQFGSGGSSTNYDVRMENNAIIGDTVWNGSTLTYALSNSANVSIGWFNNLIWNVRNSFCPSGSKCVNPQVHNADTRAFDGRPLYSVSPLIGAGNTSYVTPAFDVRGYGRPQAPAIGAYEPEQP